MPDEPPEIAQEVPLREENEFLHAALNLNSRELKRERSENEFLRKCYAGLFAVVAVYLVVSVLQFLSLRAKNTATTVDWTLFWISFFLSILVLCCLIFLPRLLQFIDFKPFFIDFKPLFIDFKPDVEESEPKTSSECLSKRTAEISFELKRVRTQKHLNLLLGSATAVFGILVLLLGFGLPTLDSGKTAASDLTAMRAVEDLAALVFSNLPRIAVSGLIEVFAFFFLRLYRSSISETRYLQNEMTNLRCWASALNLSIEHSEKANKDVLKKLLSIERNAPLSKESTTLELEQEKLYKEAQLVSLPVFERIFGMAVGGNTYREENSVSHAKKGGRIGSSRRFGR